MYKVKHIETNKFISLYGLTENILSKTNNISEILSPYGQTFHYDIVATNVANKIMERFTDVELTVVEQRVVTRDLKYNIIASDEGKQHDNCLFDVMVVANCPGEAKDRVIKHLKVLHPEINFTEGMLTVVTMTDRYIYEFVQVIGHDCYN